MSTKGKIMDIAEEMFLVHGFDGVSVRDITNAAGANVASVNYHFNSKRDLYREVFKRKLRKLSKERMGQLQKAFADKEAPTLEEVIRGIVSIFLNDFLSSDESMKLLTILSSEMSETGVARDIFLEETVLPMHKIFRTYIKKAYPDLTDEKVTLCISSIFGQIFHFVRARAVIRRTVGREYDSAFIKDLIDHITDFSVRGIRG